MDSTQPLSIESFSYSWLVNLKPSFESPDDSFRASLDASDEASFIEMDPKLSPSKRFFLVHPDFSFNFPTLQSPLTLVHADELISNGFLVPLFVKPLDMESYDSSPDSSPTTPVSPPSQENVCSFRKIRCSSFRRYQICLQKYLDLVRPLWQKVRGRRSKSTRIQKVKNWEYSPAASVCRRSCDSESSIYEAVLHCKRTVGGK